MAPEQFLWASGITRKKSISNAPIFTQDAVIEALRLYGEHVSKEVRHKAAEIAVSDLTPDEKHRDVMNIKIQGNDDI